MSDSLEKLFREGAVWFGSPPADRNLKGSKPGDALEQILKAVKSPAQNTAEQNETPAVTFDIPEIDTNLPGGGFPFGSIHEWFYDPNISFPPCLLLSWLAGRALEKLISFENNYSKNLLLEGKENFERYIFWIGRDSWPAPFVIKQCINSALLKAFSGQAGKDVGGKSLFSDTGLFLQNCIFIDPPSRHLAKWSVLTALSSPAAAVVVCDLDERSPAMTKRFSLAAKKGSSIGFFIRNSKFISVPGTALTRWETIPVPSNSLEPAWKLKLIRCKGSQPSVRSWIVENFYGEGYETVSLRLSSGAGENLKKPRPFISKAS